ncbi:MAG: radical SAM protein [Bacteroidota bacterium]
MKDSQFKIFGPSKVKQDHHRIESYLRGEQIYPTTMEMDLTQLCTRSCSGCPYSGSRRPSLTLQIPFIDRLFSILGPHTPGIVLSGGESTIVPHFPKVLRTAREKGFREIAVISNGANIHKPEVQDALMEYGTSIRISMYDWQDGESVHFRTTLQKIQGLRDRIEKEGSKLEIGASILTRTEWNHRYEPVGLQALSAGIDWLYFHPYCIDWDQKYPVQANQTGVIEAIEHLEKIAPKDANIQIPYERYDTRPLYFEKLHGSFFLIQIGANGVNYAGPESKYEEDSELLNLNEYLEDDFLWHPQRIDRLNKINSDNYRFQGTKHRPPVFSDYIQKLIQLGDYTKAVEYIEDTPDHFAYPNII